MVMCLTSLAIATSAMMGPHLQNAVMVFSTQRPTPYQNLMMNFLRMKNELRKNRNVDFAMG